MRKTIKLISVPFDSAHFNKRMGAGPLHIMESGLIKRIENSKTKVFYKEIREEQKFPTEIATSFKLLDLLRMEVKQATRDQSLPIILSGNCSATVGVIAGLEAGNIGVIWLDTHGDCETPDTTTSGFLDGMGMSMLLNRCWQNLLSLYKLNTSITGERIALIGARDLSKYEEQFIKANGINYISVDDIKRSNIERIETICTEFLRSGIQKLHLHIDVDVIDPSVAPSNSYAVKNGLNKNEVFNLINSCTSKIPLSSVTIASYDPSLDKDSDMLEIINELIETIIKQYNKMSAQKSH